MRRDIPISPLRTVDVQRTKHGGSEAFQKLEEDPRWRVIFNGYAFSIDYREERGHAYMLNDQRETQRVLVAKQYGNCLHCHAAVLPAYREQGLAAGVPADEAHRQAAIMRGFVSTTADRSIRQSHHFAPDHRPQRSEIFTQGEGTTTHKLPASEYCISS